MKIDQKLEGKKIRLTDTDGEVFEVKVTDYIYPEDNEPEGTASIIIWDKSKNRSVEFLETDIKSIVVIA